MTDRLPYPPPFMDLATLSQHVCVGESTIENWVKMGIFPAPRKNGGKNLWRWREVERYLAGESPVGHDSRTDLERITDATRRAATKGH